MASVRLPCSPSTPFFATEQHQTYHKTPLSSFPHKPFSQFSHSIYTNNSFLSCSLSLSHSHIRMLPIRTNKVRHFVLQFSSTTQDPVADSADSQPELETKFKEEEEEEEEAEFSRTRLLAQNVPWTCTAEDIRGLFEKFGTVVDVELSMYNKIRNRGLAFVSLGSPEEAVTALKNLDSYEFQGRSLKMNYAKLKWKKPSQLRPSKPPITFNLFVANLPFEAKAKDLKEFFNAEGANIVSAEIVYHDNPRRPSGYGFVAFKTKKEADNALSAFSGKEFMGRPIRVARSRQFVREPREDGSQSDDSSTELESRVEQANKVNNS